MNDADVLRDLREWFDERRVELVHNGYEAEFTQSPPDRMTQSAWVRVASARRIAQLVVWDTGDAQLSMGDVESGTVAEEHREITTQIGLRDATDALIGWLGEAGT